MDEDPISQFFPDDEDVDLYAVLDLKSDASVEDIKKAYRRAALRFHPDKHSTASEEARGQASLKFQQVGFAYTVLGDEKRRAYYDNTGKTSEGLDLDPGEDGWEAYFEQMFDRVTKGKLDEMKKAYQGSEEEIRDVKEAYFSSGGSIEEIMRHVIHSTYEDEPRFIGLIDDLIKKGELKATKTWKAEAKDEKARLVREKQGKKEATEAEALAKELGVWDEFYGWGKEGPRRGKGKGKASGSSKSPKKQPAATADEDEDGDVEDTAALQALILKRKKKMDGFFDNLAAKYAEPEPSSKKKKGKRKQRDADEDEVDESPRKKTKGGAPAIPDIPDDEFEALQQKLFGDKSKPVAPAVAKEKKNTRARKTK